jgi:hypothetical protein
VRGSPRHSRGSIGELPVAGKFGDLRGTVADLDDGLKRRITLRAEHWPGRVNDGALTISAVITDGRRGRSSADGGNAQLSSTVPLESGDDKLAKDLGFIDDSIPEQQFLRDLFIPLKEVLPIDALGADRWASMLIHQTISLCNSDTTVRHEEGVKLNKSEAALACIQSA